MAIPRKMLKRAKPEPAAEYTIISGRGCEEGYRVTYVRHGKVMTCIARSMMSADVHAAIMSAMPPTEGI